MTNDEKLLKALEALQADVSTIKLDIGGVKHGQTRLEQGQARTNTALEAIAACQKDLWEKVGGLETGQKAMRSEMATKADMQDLDAKLVKRVNSHEKRIDDLEKEAGLPNPHKN